MTPNSSPEPPAREQPFSSRALAREQNPDEPIHTPPEMNPRVFVVPWLVCIFGWVIGLACLHEFAMQIGKTAALSGG